MSDLLEYTIKTAVVTWGEEQFKTTDIFCYVFPDEYEADRFIVVFAVAGFEGWRAVEAWIEDHAVVSINDLGEGVPPDGAIWPWD